MKKAIAILLCLCLTVCTLATFAPVSAAEARTECVVLGADLSEAEIESVYQTFGLTRGSVSELILTNAEERSYLEGLVEDDVIGTRSLSCVYFRQLDLGAGADISADNVTWCTEEMYRSALETSGITDVRVMVTAPYQVSGTAALAGIYKAYENVTGETLDETIKQVGAQELVTTADLADELGKYDAAQLVDGLKSILSETKNMTDDELATEITALAKDYNITLNDGQTQQLVSLCRQLEGLSDGELAEKVADVQETVKKLGEAAETVGEVRQSVSGFLENAQSVIQQIRDFFSGLFGGRQ